MDEALPALSQTAATVTTHRGNLCHTRSGCDEVSLNPRSRNVYAKLPNGANPVIVPWKNKPVKQVHAEGGS